MAGRASRRCFVSVSDREATALRPCRASVGVRESERGKVGG